MVKALGILLVCQLAGEIAARALSLPVPGPVLGLALLFLALQLSGRWTGVTPETVEGTDLGRVAGGLLGALGLLFVPAGAGVVGHLGLFGEHGVALLAALVGSTGLALAATVLVFVAVSRRAARMP